MKPRAHRSVDAVLVMALAPFAVLLVGFILLPIDAPRVVGTTWIVATFASGFVGLARSGWSVSVKLLATVIYLPAIVAVAGLILACSLHHHCV